MSNFQFNCQECGFISRICRHEAESLAEFKETVMDALRVAANHLSDRDDPFWTARNAISAAMEKVRPNQENSDG